jgi:alpha-galactosidase
MHDNGGKVWQWDYNSSIQQRWWLFEDKTIRPAGDTTMCLDANPNTNYIGGTIYLWKCNGSAQQIWYRTGAAGYQNGYSLRCLDANPNTNWNGGTIYQWDCNNSAQQRWTSFS